MLVLTLFKLKIIKCFILRYGATGLFLTLYHELLVLNTVDSNSKYFFMPRSFTFLVRDRSSSFLLLTTVSLRSFNPPSLLLLMLSMDQSADLHNVAELCKTPGWQGPLETVWANLLLKAGS